MQPRPVTATDNRISFKETFGKVLTTIGEVLKTTVVQEVSKVPAVQQEIDKQKTTMGKNVLWDYFPLIMIGFIAAVVIGRFK